MNLKTIPKKYRPVPFWSWNEKLTCEETEYQVMEMHQAGMGGFFMHARGGLQTQYMGEEWFNNISTAVETAEKCGMLPWAYDENGWPSGFCGGVVNGLGVEYQQKFLRMEEKNRHPDTFLCKCGEHYFYYEVNPYYVDILDKKVVSEFIRSAYEPYYEKYGNRIQGFFTDEPQISRNGIAWSFVFEKEYQERYQENLLEQLDQLFLPVRDYKNIRIKFWKMVTDLFSESYMKQIYDWCNARNLKFTGHLDHEESLLSQIATNGACMPHYEYMNIPGMDWLGRRVYDCLTPLQTTSVAEQFGKEAVLSETFALCGHNVSFAELKGIYEWQMVHGVNLLCQHLQGYSIRGIRKRDYPPVMYLQQPWWCEYDRFVEAMSRVGMILREGEHIVDVLVLHPQTTAWTLFDNGENEGLKELEDALLQTIKELEKKHIEFHFGDETIMERHAKVRNGKILIGKQSYSYVVDPGCEFLLENTMILLEEFKKTGGKVITTEQLPVNAVIDNENITYSRRKLPKYNVHYFVNTSPKRQNGLLTVNGKKLDIYTGELTKFSGLHQFEPWGSLMVIEEIGSRSMPRTGQEMAERDSESNLLKVKGRFRVVESSLNSLTLDKCDYYFDGELQERNGYVLNICERANELGREIKIHQDYHVAVDFIPEKLYLVCETPEKFEISVNGRRVEEKDEGFFVDKSFRKIEISKYVKHGENVISFDCIFRQSEEFYRNFCNAKRVANEKNKLAYDMEIEAIYLLGDFSVRTDGEWSRLGNLGMRYRGDFVLDVPGKEIEAKHIEKQGYPFFCGQLVLEGFLDIEGQNPVLEMDWRGINACRVQINEMERVLLTDNRLPLKEFGAEGHTKVRFTLTNNLRNLLGPHHLEQGESLSVRPSSFFKEPCVWNNYHPLLWDDGYCFVETGI